MHLTKPRHTRFADPGRKQQARSHLPPLEEHSSQGTYVNISTPEGKLHLVSDSMEWFDWFPSSSLPVLRESRVAFPHLENPIVGDQSAAGQLIVASTAVATSIDWG